MSPSLSNGILRAVFLLLALRLLTWVFLLPPWAGFDEPHHQAYAEVCAQRLVWPSFRGVVLPERLIAEMRRWPLPGASARAAAGETNYETQQSPLYYWMAGLGLRWLRLSSPIEELYALRLANAALALAVGWLLWRSAASLGFGESAWMSVALIAFVPGYGIALTRVSNDALCAALLALAVEGTLSPSPRARLAGAVAGGLAPWAKLYGAAALPALAGEAVRPGGGRLRAARLLLLAAPAVLLGLASWWIHGHVLAMQENLHPRASVSLAEVPWARDAWTIVKTHVWVSGISGLVFPNVVYVVAAGLLVFAAVRSLRIREPVARKTRLPALVPVLLVLFVAALAYHAWRNFSFFGGPGGTGGWYLWAMAVPEALLLSRGFAADSRPARWLASTLLLFLLLTIAGDLILVADAAGRVIATPARHVIGIELGEPARLLDGFLSSRPRPVGLAGLACAVVSWVVGAGIVLRSSTVGPPR